MTYIPDWTEQPIAEFHHPEFVKCNSCQNHVRFEDSMETEDWGVCDECFKKLAKEEA